MDQSTNKTIKNLKTPVIFKIIIFIIFFLSIIAIISIYDRTFFTNLFTGSSSIDSKTSSTIFFVIFFAFLVIFFKFRVCNRKLLPNLSLFKLIL